MVPVVNAVRTPPPPPQPLPIERVELTVSEGVARAIQFLLMHHLEWVHSPHTTELELLYGALERELGPSRPPRGYRGRQMFPE